MCAVSPALTAYREVVIISRGRYLEIDRELHPDAATEVSLPYDAHSSLNALSPNRHVKAGGPVSYLDRNFHHLRSPLPVSGITTSKGISGRSTKK